MEFITWKETTYMYLIEFIIVNIQPKATNEILILFSGEQTQQYILKSGSITKDVDCFGQ